MENRSAVAFQNPKILIIDDDKNFSIGVSRLLIRANFDVITAHDGDTGISKAQQDQPDLILLDVNMPQMNGFQVKAAIDANPLICSIPVVFLTAMADHENVLKGLEKAEDYISKPVDGDILTARVKSVLKRVKVGYSRAVQDFKNSIITVEGQREFGQAVEVHDEGTAGHTQRVAVMAVMFARSLGLPEEDLQHIRKGAMLHDIGKLAIPESVLNKKEPLSSEEWLTLQEHPQIGYSMISLVENLHPALDIIKYHHERWDGSGYPEHLKGEEIPLSARLFTIVDVYDALSSDRPYKKRSSVAESIEILKKGRGKQFDPALVDHFILHFDQFIERVLYE
ncbi:MAG: response regulator [Chloroflexi bacterium]|nr:response regulator [Chloroflexota bacterium]